MSGDSLPAVALLLAGLAAGFEMTPNSSDPQGHSTEDGIPPRPSSAVVNDRNFVVRGRKLGHLYDFVMSELSEIPGATLGDISQVVSTVRRTTYARRGRPVSAAEWSELERANYDLNLLTSLDLRKKYRLSSFPDVVHFLTIWALIVSIVSLMTAVYPQPVSDIAIGATDLILHWLGHTSTSIDASSTRGAIRLCCFLIWLMSLGGLGSVAFVSVNALSIQADATFDISNTRFVILRIMIGALFSVLIAFPLSIDEFIQFCNSIASRITVPLDNVPAREGVGVQFSQIALLLLPFILGFSTSLVLLLMNRLIEGIKSLFGIVDKAG
jgi:hypothetical protein